MKAPFLVDFAKLTRLNDELAVHVDDSDIDMIAENNDAFHAGLYENYPNRLLIARLIEIWNEVRMPRNNMYKSEIFTRKTPAEHSAILGGIRSEDPDRAAAAMSAHYASARESAIATFPVSGQFDPGVAAAPFRDAAT